MDCIEGYSDLEDIGNQVPKSTCSPYSLMTLIPIILYSVIPTECSWYLLLLEVDHLIKRNSAL